MIEKAPILYLVFVLLVCLCACAPSESTWHKQYDLGVRYLSEGNYEEAIIAFTAAIEIGPKQALAYVGRGDAYVASGETEEHQAAAQADYEKAIELDEFLTEAYLGFAGIYIQQGDYEDALKLLQNALEKIDNRSSVEAKISELEKLIESSLEQETQEEYTFRVQAVENDMIVEAENLAVHVRDDRTAAITVSGLSLEDSYLTNLHSSGKNSSEYLWEVKLYGNQKAYSVSTSCWAFDPGAEKVKAIADMQHSLWVNDGDSWPRIADVEMSYTKSSITWTFTVPDEYPFDFSSVNRYEVGIKDISLGLTSHKVYTPG